MSPRASAVPLDARLSVMVHERDLLLLEQISRHHGMPIDRLLERVIEQFADQQRRRLRGAASNRARARASSKETT